MTKRTHADIASRAPINSSGLVSSEDFNDLLDSSVGRVTTASISGAATYDYAAGGDVAILTLTGNVTSFSISGGVAGHRLWLGLKQDATGGRGLAGVTGIAWEGASAPALTATPNRVDWFPLVFDGTTWQQWATAAMNVG